MNIREASVSDRPELAKKLTGLATEYVNFVYATRNKLVDLCTRFEAADKEVMKHYEACTIGLEFTSGSMSVLSRTLAFIMNPREEGVYDIMGLAGAAVQLLDLQLELEEAGIKGDD